MNAELEALLKALQAVFEARGPDDTTRLESIYEKQLEDAGERLGVSKEFLRTAVWGRYGKWIKGQDRPPTIPPKA